MTAFRASRRTIAATASTSCWSAPKGRLESSLPRGLGLSRRSIRRAVAWLGSGKSAAGARHAARPGGGNRPDRGFRDPPAGVAGGGPLPYSGHSRAVGGTVTNGMRWSKRRPTAADSEPPAELLTRLLAPLIDRGLGRGCRHFRRPKRRPKPSGGSATACRRPSALPSARRPSMTSVCAVEDMPLFMAEAAAEVERAFPGTSASGFGHLGDGNIHFHVRAGTRGGPDWLEREGAAVSGWSMTWSLPQAARSAPSMASA